MGIACLDMAFYQEAMPEENSKSRTEDYAVFIGGPPANAAITYALLGGRAVLISQIGDSAMGRLIKSELEDKYGIEVIDTARGLEILPSISCIGINTRSGDRTIWSGQPKAAGAPEEAAIAKALENAAFCLTDCNLKTISLKVMQSARAAGVPTVLDPGSWKDHLPDFLAAAGEVIAPKECVPRGMGTDLYSLASSLGVRHFAVTDGGSGIWWKTGEAEGTILPPAVEAVDTLGAGDIFHGAYCWFRYAKGLPFDKALAEASKAAAASVAMRGPRDGILAYLEKQEAADR